MGNNLTKKWKSDGEWHSKAAKAAYMKKWNAANREKNYEYWINRKERYLKAIYELLGAECCKCGYTDKRALQFDHKLGGGNKELQSFGNSRTKLYKEILTNPEKFQVLCANCNWIKRHENQEGTGFGSMRKLNRKTRGSSNPNL